MPQSKDTYSEIVPRKDPSTTASLQESFAQDDATRTPLSLYIHWPFCAKKCPYCDYNSHVRAAIDEQTWETALLNSLRATAELTPNREITSIFFGGGTPSLMPASTVAALLAAADATWGLSTTCEITLEANPTNLETSAFNAFRDAGVNRLSIGVQALNDVDLQFLGRQHDSATALKAVETASQLYDRWSLDLMYGRPNQTPEGWQRELETALATGPQHLSCYQLTIMENTTFQWQLETGRFTLPDDEILLDLDAVTKDLTTQHGLQQYEISSYAVAGQECRHNLHYWRYGEYAGVGPGAHGRLLVDGVRTATEQIAMPEKFLHDTSIQQQPLSIQDEVSELFLAGLRTKVGVALADYQNITGEALNVESCNQLQEEGLLTITDTHLIATAKGWQFLNQLEYQLIDVAVK